ncbi:biotin synthase BioB [Porcipelethomonas sp.]|uniref:biotin synthase BioB n=1 Tax=Porcipelethomonas sp. TaxID=2981675 RepID=UPI003EF18F30
MSIISELKEKILNGGQIDKSEAMKLWDADYNELCSAANEIRKKFCSDDFDICTIINGKSGKCSENCKFCAQSSFYHTGAGEYPLLDTESIVKEARYNASQGILRFSIVTSGRKLNEKEIDIMCDTVREIHKNTNISVCVSFGLLNEEQYRKLKDAGVSRVHNNIETSGNNFKNICTTHTFDDKINAINAAKRAGLNVCSGGIMGLGETNEDRTDMAFTLKELNIKSVPLNMLNPIAGTPFENNKKLTEKDMCRICAVYRFILPDASIRLAGGRGLMTEKGKECFQSGANAAISGDMLTTSGITIETDMKMIQELNYKPALCNE